jgi:hypothetical protein
MGAVRVEQQLTGQSLLIPQGGDVSMASGQLESLRTTAGQCNCELQLTERVAHVLTQISALASTDELRKRAAEQKPTTSPEAPAEKEEPVYQVIMPPLRYDANVKVQRDYDPNLILLVRRARVRPTLIFQGRVEGDPVIAQVSPPVPVPNALRSNRTNNPTEDSTWGRVRIFFHKLWSPNS